MKFQGDKKFGQSILAGPEGRLRDRLLPLVPPWLETHHLTLTTVLWSVLVLVFSFLARHSIHWMWLTSLMIALQYVTDLLDGAVGRSRETGLVKWGFYMDHLLDYIFLCCILIGYAGLFPSHYAPLLFYVLMIFGAFMVNSFLSFAATNRFQIAYLGIGPTEIRIVFIGVNTLIIVLGRTYMKSALPTVLGLATFGLFVTVVRTQKELWDLDMRAKGVRPEDQRHARGRWITLALCGLVAGSLILLGYAGWVLAPLGGSPLAEMGDAEIRSRVTDDLARIDSLRATLDDSIRTMGSGETEPAWRHIEELLGELEELEAWYAPYGQISYVDRPEPHADAFFTGYQAARARFDALTGLHRKLRAGPSRRAIQRGLMDSDLLLRISAGKMYLPLVREDLGSAAQRRLETGV